MLLHYTKVFDVVVDAAYYARALLNFSDIPVVMMENGWPSMGDAYSSSRWRWIGLAALGRMIALLFRPIRAVMPLTAITTK